MDCAKIIEVIKELTTAGKDSAGLGEEKDLDAVLQNNMCHVLKLLEKDLGNEVISKELYLKDSDDFRLNFVKLNLDLLVILKDCLQHAKKEYELGIKQSCTVSQKNIKKETVPPISPDTLSFSQQKVICTSLQFIVCLGICPNLQPGVGIPLEKRSGFAHLLNKSNCKELSVVDKQNNLGLVVRKLLECIPQPSLGSLILSRHLTDVLAALIQICFHPKKSIQTNEGKIEVTGNSSAASAIKGTSSLPSNCDVAYFKDQLQKLLNHVYQPSVVRELLMLQGGPGPVPSAQAGKPPVLVRAPPWLRRTCGQLLSERLMQPQGIQHVLRGILDISPQNPQAHESLDWRKCDAAARIIATCPMNFSAETYIASLAPQIIEIVNFPDKMVARPFLRVAVGIISIMMAQYRELTEKYLMRPILRPLYACLEDNYIESAEDKAVLVVGESALTSCISDLHKIFVTGSEPQSKLLDVLQPFGHTLFILHGFLTDKVSHLKTPVKEILSTFLKYQDTDKCLACLYLFAFGQTQNFDMPLTRFHPWLSLANGSEGGVMVMNTGGREIDWEASGKQIVSLLQTLGRDEVSAEFFISMLKRLTAMVAVEISGSHEEDQGPTSPNFLEQNDPEEQEVGKLVTNLITLSLVSEMCETLGHACFKNKGHILDFVKVTLERGVKVLENTDDEVFSVFESETMTMAMGLLTAVLSEPKQITHDEREKSKELLPLLQLIADNHTSEEVKSMASDLRIAIATHSLVQMEETKQKAEALKKTLTQSKQRLNKQSQAITSKNTKTVKSGIPEQKRPLIEVLESTENRSAESKKGSSHQNKDDMTISQGAETLDDGSFSTRPKSSVEDQATNSAPSDPSHPERAFQRALEELMDPLVPVRGHALITLKRLVEQKDPTVLDKQELLLNIFKENLNHEDTYIYLSAIQGLVALADINPEKVVPVLIGVYANCGDSDGKGNSSSEQKIKIGEIVMKTLRNLGDILPKYGDLSLNGILHVVKHPDHFVRASALSNLGEVCKMLHFSLGKDVNEIVDCLSKVLKSDPEAEPRKAAAMVITLILQGLGKDSIQVLGSTMRDLYHLLKSVHGQETDETVKAHVDLSLQEMDTIMKDFLFPKQSFSKKISILDPPDNYKF